MIHVKLKDFERVEQAPFFRTKVGCARSTGEMAWTPSPLRPSCVFFSHALKNEPKNYLAPAMQAIERATNIFILNTLLKY